MIISHQSIKSNWNETSCSCFPTYVKPRKPGIKLKTADVDLKACSDLHFYICCVHFGHHALKSTSAAFTLAPGPSSPRLLLSLWPQAPQVQVCCFHFGSQAPQVQVCCFHFGPQGPQVHICCFHFGPQALKSTSAAFTLAPGPSSLRLLLSLWPPYHPSPHLLLSLWPPGPQVHVCCFHFGPRALKFTSAAVTLVPGPQIHICCFHFGPLRAWNPK